MRKDGSVLEEGRYASTDDGIRMAVKWTCGAAAGGQVRGRAMCERSVEQLGTVRYSRSRARPRVRIEKS